MAITKTEAAEESQTVKEPFLASQRVGEKNDTLQISNRLKPPGIREGKKHFQYLATFAASLMGMESGMTLGWTSPILPYLTSPESFLPHLTQTQISWITSLLALGAIVGAVPAGKIADRIGRKRSIALTVVPLLISWIGFLCTDSVEAMYAARFIGGIGSGAICVLLPVYIGEIAEPSVRGALGAFFPLLFSTGIVYSYVMGAYLSYTMFNVCCCAILLPFAVCAPFLPESPIWLIANGRETDADKVLKVIRGKEYDSKQEIMSLQEEARRLETKKGGFTDLIGTQAGRRAIVTAIGLMWFQQMSGIDAVLFYTVSIFQAANSTIEPFLATIVIGVIEIVMTVFVAMIIDRFGRKPLLVISGVGMTICLGVLGYYFKLKDAGNDVLSIGWLPLISLSLYNVVFSIGYGSVPFAVISEIFPTETKGVASSISIVFHWSLVFAVTKLFPTMEESMGQAITFWTFSFFTGMSAIFSYFVVPETKGKTLQEIQKKLARKRKSERFSVEPA